MAIVGFVSYAVFTPLKTSQVQSLRRIYVASDARIENNVRKADTVVSIVGN